MNFDQSGLPPIQLVQDAFNHSFTYLMATVDEEMVAFERQVTRAHHQNLAMLEQQKTEAKMTEAQIKQTLEEIERVRKHNMSIGPAIIRRELEKAFVKSHLNPARELFRSAEHAAPEALAAIMLVECVRSPRDFQQIQDTFGPVVAGLLSDLIHAEAYGIKRTETLSKSNDDVKRAYAAMSITSLDNISDHADQIRKQDPKKKPAFSDGYEQQVLENGKATWGADAKLDARLVSAFNRAAEKVTSVYRMEKDANGALQLVRATPPKPPTKPNLPVVRPKVPNNGALGDDPF